MSSHKKVRFLFQNSEGGDEVESMWCIEREGGYAIDNIPFYVGELASGDIVDVREDEDGLLWFAGLRKPSGHSTIRILFDHAEDVRGVRVQLRELGCSSELSDFDRLVAVNIPPAVEYEKVKEFLDEGMREGRFEYEEACLGFL